MAEKITTIEGLAALIQRTMASKEDITSVKEDIKRVEQIQKDTLEELIATHTDVSYLKTTVDKLTQSDIAQDAAIQDLGVRVHRLEQKAR